MAGNLIEKLLKFSVSKEQSWNWCAIMQSKNWASKLNPPHQIHNSNDTGTALLSRREIWKYSFNLAKCLLDSSEGLGAMSFSGIAQQLKTRLKANVLLCFPKPGLKYCSEKHPVI